ncbi:MULTISPECIES: DUF3800 domain-containing protein [unclassified Bradyrhizobium]|uniref:DUF3800 domain-containing protein n=1 Tax=unclassified Bradyrhizobium TaxID=2631580 RepID=UPI0028E5D0AC|nr:MULTISPECIES: DUF3800 domain-containing protein [unclassified Bradyrhizobium]
MAEILEIACDEAGHTGPDLLHKDQRMFAFASVAAGDTEAFEIIAKARRDHPVQMPELKASKLLASERGRRLVGAIFQAVDGRYVVNVHDKLLALCGWLFEYIYEPVYQDDPSLLYQKKFHQFVAMFSYLWMLEAGGEARPTIEQFQKYMRSRDPADAPFLFDRPRPPLTEEGNEHPFESILRFAYGYRDIIIADNANLDHVLPDKGRWTLDLSTSSLWSHLNHWGRTGKLLSVRCDASKPLQASVVGFTGDENDPGIKRARMNHDPEPLGWKLLDPIAFVDSRDHPAVQLADVIAGTTVAFSSGRLPPGCDAIVEGITRHGHGHSILPDIDIVDLRNRTAAVNFLILFDLAKRAERHGDPYENLEAMYHFAEVSWASGEFEATRSRRSQGG